MVGRSGGRQMHKTPMKKRVLIRRIKGSVVASSNGPPSWPVASRKQAMMHIISITGAVTFKGMHDDASRRPHAFSFAGAPRRNVAKSAGELAFNAHASPP